MAGKMNMVTISTLDINGELNEFNKKECIKYLNNYYHINNPNVYFNKITNKYSHKNSKSVRNLILTIDDFKDNKYILVFDEKNKYKHVLFYIRRNDTNKSNENLTNNLIECYIDYKKAIMDENLIFNSEHRCFHHISLLDLPLFSKSERQQVDVSRGYNIEDCDDYQECKINYESFKIKFTENILKFKPYLYNKTFGIELETCKGDVIPVTKSRYGFTTCRDGSIDNLEFVSIPMKGLKGLQSVHEFCKQNKFFVKTDYKCSLHVHVGNVRTDKLFLNAFYNFLLVIQKDYFEYFPYYKKENILNKSKHYTKPMYDITIPHKSENLLTKQKLNDLVNRNVNEIYRFLTDGHLPNKFFNRKNRLNPIKGPKWNLKNRYHVVNLMNLLFSERKTIEFRIHENTFNEEKVINQILLSIAMVRYVEQNIKKCLTMKCVNSIEKLINEMFSNNEKEDLIKYYSERKKLFKSDKNEVFKEYTNY